MENRQIKWLGVALMALFLALFVNLNLIQVVNADRLANDPRNTRNAVRDFSQPRGEIISADGTVLASSRDTGDSFKRQRVYPPATASLFGHVTGFFSFTYGADGVERRYNKELAGKASRLKLHNLGDLLLDRKRTANVTLTMPLSVQQAAAQALGNRVGAVVALDPRSGAVLALYSFPSYDPNPLAGHDQQAVQHAHTLLMADQRKPMLPRSFREIYFPGSTFKVVTASTALATGLATPAQPVYPTQRELKLPQTTRTLKNFGGEACGGNLAQALRVSCNTVFGQIGLDLGGQKLVGGAEAFGFNSKPPLDLPAVAESHFPPVDFFKLRKPALAQSAIGQNDVAASPLQTALTASAIANGGVIMKPHVMREVRDDQGDLVEQSKPEPWRRAVDPAVADQVRAMMIDVVNAGTARSVAIPGIQVAAKTGTAQLGTTPPSSHAWMVAFAPAEAPRVAVAVIVVGQPGVSEVTGARVAGPVARAVLQAALQAVPS